MRHLPVITIILSLSTFTPGMTLAAQPNRGAIGLAIVPRISNFPDTGEKLIYQHVRENPNITSIVPAASPERLFDILNHYRKRGIKIKHLVIAGHGSTIGASIKFGATTMTPEYFDLRLLKEKIEKHNKELAAKWKQLKGARDAQKRTIESESRPIVKKIQAFLNRQAKISVAREALADNAKVILLTCRVQKGSKGEQFVKDFGQILLGRGGGQIRAMTTDVALGSPRSRLIRDALQWLGHPTIRTRPVTNPQEFNTNTIKPKHKIKPHDWTWWAAPQHPWHGKSNHSLMTKAGIKPEFYIKGFENTYFYRGPSGELITQAGINTKYADLNKFKTLFAKVDSGTYPKPKTQTKWPKKRWEIWQSKTNRKLRLTLIYL